MLSALCGLALALQAVSARADAGSEDFYAQVWQTEEGLPDNAVNDVAQTPDGYLWLATLKGLVRFDGVRFRVFTAAETPGLHSSQVRKLFTARDGTLWIAAGAGGVSSLRGGAFKSFADLEAEARGAVTDALVESEAGVIWVATWSDVMLRLSGGMMQTMPRTEAGSRFNQWISSPERGMELISGKSIQAVRGDAFTAAWSSTGEALCVAPRKAGGHWLAVGRSLSIYAGGKVGDPLAELPETAPVRTMIEDRQGALWLGTEGAGLWRFAAGKFARVETSHASIRALFEDREGNLWVGTEGGGLNKVRARQFQVRGRTSGLPSEVVLSLCEDAAGALWCVSQGGGVAHWPVAENGSAVALEGVAADAVSICATPDGDLWIGTDGHGIQRIKKDGERVLYGVADGLTNDWATMLGTDREGRLLAGTVEGLSRFDGEKFSVIANGETLRGGVRALAADRVGRVWAAAGDGTLHSFRGNEHHEYGISHGLPGAVIRCLLALEDGSLWIGTDGGGLCRWREGKITRWTSQDGLREDVITQLQLDAAGEFWCGSQRGLFRVNRAQLEASVTGRRMPVESLHFGRSDGLPNFRYASEFHPRSWRGHDGRIFFATQKGVVTVDPHNIAANPLPPNVLIERMRANDRVIKADLAPTPREPLRIGPHVGSVEFTFAALSFAAPDKVRVRYQMEGLDHEWREAREAREATYLHLAPGDYRFRVTACNNDGVWNSEEAALAFTVLAPFWQAPWFVTLAAIAAAAGIGGSARWLSLLRVRQQLRRMAQRHAVEQERTRIARDLHDELGTTLTRVTLLSELAQRELPDAPRAGARIASIRTASHQMARALEEIVWSVSPANDDVEQLVGYVSQFANEYLRTAGIVCRQEVPAVATARSITAEARHHLFLAVKEALHNLVRHAHATEARLTIRIAPRELEIVIEDNGCGFAEHETAGRSARGNGLPNLRERLASIGGRCEITSAPGSGTRVHFHLPLDRSQTAPDSP